MSLADEIATFMLLNDKTWTFDGEQKIPTAEDIQQVLDEVRRRLYALDSSTGNAQMLIGGMLVKLDNGHLDVYMHIGDANA